MQSDQRRYVFDTNTLVSAVLFENGKPGRAFRYALRNATVLLSQPTFDELDEVLAREDFDDYVSLEERADFIERLVRRSRFAEPAESAGRLRLAQKSGTSAACLKSGAASFRR